MTPLDLITDCRLRMDDTGGNTAKNLPFPPKPVITPRHG
jgi:hypothetical protein